MSTFTNTDYVLIDAMAAELIAEHGSTTNLDIKMNLRVAYPGKWVQETVSAVMQELSDVEGKYEYVNEQAFDADNILREYRRYSLPVAVVAGDDDDDDLPTLPAPVAVIPPPVISTDINVNDANVDNTNMTNSPFEDIPVIDVVILPPPVSPAVPYIIPRGNILHRLRQAFGKPND